MPNWAYNKLTAKTDEDFKALCKRFLDKNKNLDFNTIVPMPDTIEHTTGVSSSEHFGMIAYLITHKSDGGVIELNTKDDVIKAIEKHNPGDSKLAEKICDVDFSTGGPLNTYNDIIHASKHMNELEKRKQDWDKHPGFLNGGRSYLHEAQNALYNLLHYGVMNWYDWSVANWGTKWNASQTCVDEVERYIYWETAWSPTVEIAQAMSKVCKEPVYYQYAEEQFTEYVGEFIFQNGEDITSSEDPGGIEQYLLAAELIDPEQTETRYDQKNKKTIFTWDMNKDELEQLYAKCPEIHQDTAIKHKFKDM